MEHVHSALELHRVHGPIGITVKVVNELDQARQRSTEAFCAPRVPAQLCEVQGISHFILHVLREGSKVPE